MIKINLYGGPGIGKSTVCASVFVELKKLGINCEVVREYAKELCYEGYDMTKLSDDSKRLGILSEQIKREKLLEGNVDYLVTDSPLLLTAFYHNYPYETPQFITDVALRHLGVHCYHFFLERHRAGYQQAGRSHSFEQSLSVDKDMYNYVSSLIDQERICKIEGSIEDKTAKILFEIFKGQNQQ